METPKRDTITENKLVKKYRRIKWFDADKEDLIVEAHPK